MARSRSTVSLTPAVLQWARERAGFDREELASKLGVTTEAVAAWEASGIISCARVDNLARRTYTPIGNLFLDEPPEDRLPIADFRTRGDKEPQRPSPNLLELVYQMQRRQLWLTDELIYQGAEPLDFVGAYDLHSQRRDVATAMSDVLGLNGGWASVEETWTSALLALRNRLISAGVFVFVSGIVGNNTQRKLDPNEFQGFALVDEYAPLIFINNSDYKTAQIFTLAHELAHIFLGTTGVSKLDRLQAVGTDAERICNEIAAEFLVPADQFLRLWPTVQDTDDPYREVARHFKVSTIVAARRALDTRQIELEEFFSYYEANKSRSWGGAAPSMSTSGGDYWTNQRGRVGERFGAAVYRATKEGRLLYREAYSLTGLNGDTFERMPAMLGFEV